MARRQRPTRTARSLGAVTTQSEPQQDGPARPWLLVIGEGVTATHALPETGDVVLGRARECAIRIEHPSISRRHARIRLGATMTIEDLGSANGTRLREQPLLPAQPRPLAVGEVVELGALMLTVQRRPERAPVKAATTPAPAAAPSAPMRELDRLLERVAAGSISVLMLGETGVGKGVLAEALHARSPRSRGPFLALNCAAFTEALLESELFGHERGAFSGAVDMKPGLLEAAQGGTVFLDEIGEMPLSIQSKLLKVLEDRVVRRLGSLKSKTIDVRFVAASNRDLEAEVAKGTFRSDLYFRLNGVALVIPPLRERVSEIEPLARAFAERAWQGLAGKGAAPTLTAAALRVLEGHRWPGNIRELRNVVERAVLLCNAGVITPAELPVDKMGAPPAAVVPATAAPQEQTSRMRGELDALERTHILDTLERLGGNQTQAAKALGMSRATLLSRLDAYDVPRPRRPR